MTADPQAYAGTGGANRERIELAVGSLGIEGEGVTGADLLGQGLKDWLEIARVSGEVAPACVVDQAGGVERR
jgi:ABC-type uncharacterized transport system ATPase subunit